MYRPVIAGMWQQHEATDGTYTLAQLLIAHEILNVKEANQLAYQQWLAEQ